MGKVIRYSGITKLDLSPDQILEDALDLDQLEGVVIMGYLKNGKEYFASSYADGGTVLWLAERMKLKLLGTVDRSELGQ